MLSVYSLQLAARFHLLESDSLYGNGKSTKSCGNKVVRGNRKGNKVAGKENNPGNGNGTKKNDSTEMRVNGNVNE